MKKLIIIPVLLLSTFSFAQRRSIPTEKEVRESIHNAGVQAETRNRSNANTANPLENLLDYSKKMTPHLTAAQLRAGLADTASVVYISDAGRSGSFVYAPGSQLKDDSSMVIVAGDRRYVRDADVIYPRFFGAKGDGKTDDTKALQKCFNYVTPNQTIDFQGLTYQFSSVRLSQTDITLRGSGARMLGTIIIGDNKPKTYNGKINGFFFNSKEDAIQILNVRKLEIASNTFNNNNKSVHILPGPTGTHVNAMIETNKNVFNDVNYCLYVDRAEKATWMVSSDFSFEGNVANNALITAVYANGIDGLKYINNVIFTPSDDKRRRNKKHHLRIDQESDWVIIANNNFFESGEESLYFENSKALNINGNNFAWSGQNGVFSVIAVKGSISGLIVNITGNIFDWFSGNVVTMGKSASGSIGLIGNTIVYADKHSRYIGKEALDKIDHYAVEALNPAVIVNENNTYGFKPVANFKSVNSVTKRATDLQSVNSTFKTSTVNVNAGKPADVFKLSNEFNTSSSYGGILTLIAKYKGSNIAMYQLMINKAAKTVTPEVKVLASSGLTEGKNTNHPSFKFQIQNDILQVVPIGKTAEEFQFSVKSEGDLIVKD